jgi:hypothetical protein
MAEAQQTAWAAGRLDPMDFGKPLPEAPSSASFFGPGMVLVALGVGLGELFMWPRLVMVFGANIRWLFFMGMLAQVFAMMEIARWSMATGESAFMAAARVWKPFMWFFWILALGTYIWPGHISLGAKSIESMWGIPWLVTAIGGIILMGVILTFAPVAYEAIEKILSIIIAIVVASGFLCAAVVGNASEWWAALKGLFAFGWTDPRMFTPEWFPALVGSMAFAGPSGMQQMWYSLYLRDKKAGMCHYAGRITSWLTAEEETMPSVGTMFNTDDPDEMRKWKAWRKWNFFDAWALFWFVTTITTLFFTVIALAAVRIDPSTYELLSGGDKTAAIQGFGVAYSAFLGSAGRAAIYGTIGLVGWKMTFGVFDAFARGQADMTWYFWPGVKDKWSMSKVYYGFLYGVMIFGIIILLTMGATSGPAFILDVMASLSTLSMGLYCLLMLICNNKFLPKEIRPGIITKVVLSMGILMYWGGFFFCLLKFGAIVG